MAIIPHVKRFWEKIFYSPDGCWYWLGAVGTSGYGSFGYNAHWYAAHRFSYELHHGKIINDLHVLHRCDNKLCVNPDHLFLGTSKDNMIDKSKKGRAGSKLTKIQVRELRHLYYLDLMKVKDIALKFGIDRHSVTAIARRKIHKYT